jgi:hypothetical protein
MKETGWKMVAAAVCACIAWAASSAAAASGDTDANGYVDLTDYVVCQACLEASGPGAAASSSDCTAPFDTDEDGDVDLADIAVFQRAMGHLPIPLRDGHGDVLTISSTEPYNARQTCGVSGCHDIDEIANGSHFQQGRTDAAGAMIMHDDFWGDGRWWIRSAGMYGRWSGGSGGFNRQMSGKNNASASVMDLTTFSWVYECGACHVGGGPAEFDRSGELLYGYYDDTQSYQFGYERSGLTAGDVALDGDYAYLDVTDGTVRPAPWDVTGVADPECLHCHRADRTWDGGLDMHREWRAEVLATNTALVDDLGNPVPAFASAGTAGQGWFSILDTQADPPVLQIDYQVGVGNESLVRNQDDTLSLPESALALKPTDGACWGCHSAGGAAEKRGMVWFDDRDVHFKNLTQRNDEDPVNDIPDEKATACSHCHPGNLEHNVAKGDSPYTQFRNDLDWAGFRSCRQCHFSVLPDLSPNPDKDPDAPDASGIGDVIVHGMGFFEYDVGMMRTLSCQACHIRHPLERALLVTDWSVTGSAIHYYTDEFLSADPLDPSNPDKSTWYPSFGVKIDSDGLDRFFPQKEEIAIHWADWDKNGTPEDMSDDTVQPIILWRLKQITGDQPLTGVMDDNGDDKPEINTPAEMLLYMQALKGNDSHGQPVALNPVLVKGERVWYEDPGETDGVNWFDPEVEGITVEAKEVYGLDHNIQPADESWGYAEIQTEGCSECHRPDTRDSAFFDRLILVDPFDVNGEPQYKTVLELTGWEPL